MAPIVAVVHKARVDQRLGIGLASGNSMSISSIAEDGLFVGSGLRVGQQVLSINNINCHGMSSGDAVRILRTSVGQITVIADDPVQTAVVATVVADRAPRASEIAWRQPSFAVRDNDRRTGHLILKKSWKTEKYFSFHGPMSQDDIDTINAKLRQLLINGGANCLQFTLENNGHFIGKMNHQAQEYYEEDFTVVILDALQQLGWSFRLRYEAEESHSHRLTCQTGDSVTLPPKEVFMFNRMHAE
mmetsp:Transcript_12418/g.29317  ORF Transcript_12418/g.29317 Transcript_12418/m.29317 type:complete len:244 (+) Transcript_12418:372-1103(+)